MELMAAISALNALKEPCEVDLHTDSNYVRDGISKWIEGWKRNGWKTADRKPQNASSGRRWTRRAGATRSPGTGSRAIAGHPENERADELSRAGMAPSRPGRRVRARAARQKAPPPIQPPAALRPRSTQSY